LINMGKTHVGWDLNLVDKWVQRHS